MGSPSTKCLDQTHQWRENRCITCKAIRKKERAEGITRLAREVQSGNSKNVREFKAKMLAKYPYCMTCKSTRKILLVDHDHNIHPMANHACAKCFRGVVCNSCNKLSA